MGTYENSENLEDMEDEMRLNHICWFDM